MDRIKSWSILYNHMNHSRFFLASLRHCLSFCGRSQRNVSAYTVKTQLLLLSLILVAFLSVGCTDRDTTQTLSPEAAASFATLPPLSLREEKGLQTFQIIPAQSQAVYVVDEELFPDATRKYGLAVGKTKVTGVTQDVEGLLQIDLAGNTIGVNRFAVYLPTLRTDQSLRDGWIQDNALESNRFPLAVFIATQIRDAPQNYQEGDPTRFQLDGALTLRGMTLPTVWNVTASLRGDTISASAETRLQMTDFGFDPPNFANTLTVQNEFTIRIDFIAVEQ